MNNYQGRRVLVVGLARSGCAVARLLAHLGSNVFICDAKDDPKLRLLAQQLVSEGVLSDHELGGSGERFLEQVSLVVISPGVPMSSEIVEKARLKGIEVVSEMEVAYSVCPAPVIAVTGTNGKTTTTTLIYLLLSAAGFKAHCLGNIGKPFSEEVLRVRREDWVVLEVSSFQLEAIKTFSPRIALILNLTPDHLDRYAGLNDYLAAKKNIFLFQTCEDYLLLNDADPVLRPLEKEARSRVVFFNRPREQGDWNQNQRAVLAVAEILGLDRSLCEKVLRDFKGVEHRMEFVAEIDGVEFINDSKATNLDSTRWALENTSKPIILIAGGRDKGSDFASILDLAVKKVKFAVLIGEAAERIEKAWSPTIRCQRAEGLADALSVAKSHSSLGECVLFSPMCKSFDMFRDYEDRGRIFKSLVNGLKL